MLEAVVIVIILGVFTAMVVARVTDRTAELVGQTDVIKTRLRYAQSRAMNSSIIWGIQFSGNSYSLFKNGNTADRVILPGENADTVSLPTGMSAGTAVVSFDGWGIPHTDAAATTPGGSIITVSGSGGNRTITVTQNTGFVP
jgi:MSHA pilin protein MshC